MFRSRRMYQTDRESDMATAEDRGIQKGRIEGRVEGKVEGRTEVARNAIDIGMDIDMIIKLTGLTFEEIESLKTFR